MDNSTAANILSSAVPELTTAMMMHNSTNGTAIGAAHPKSKIVSLIITVMYVMGILGNAAAIIALRRGERRVRNRKYLLLLTSLAVNDLVALVGMMCAMVVAFQCPWVQTSRAYCASRVVLRVFGIGSVCIAVTMALERYLALTRPFVYQKQVTYYAIRLALLMSWFWAALLTCAPILGLGLYYDDKAHVCKRYRNAVNSTDFAYAVFYVAFGTVLCVVLVYCNFAVIRALYAIRAPQGGAVVRRVSKNSCVLRQRAAGSAQGPPVAHNAATAEEVAFSRLMATLSVLFMICWLPQMVMSALYLSVSPKTWPKLNTMGIVSDLMMQLNYVLNPLLYVLMQRSRRVSISSLCHSVAHCFKRSHKSSNSSMKTTCCPQETTMLASDGSSGGAELRPLRAPAISSTPRGNSLL